MISVNDLSYTAPKPKKSWKTWAWQIACRIIFPPIIVWDTASFILNLCLGKMVGKLIVLAQKKKFSPAGSDAIRDHFVGKIVRSTDQQTNVLHNKMVSVKTHDGASLETFQTIYSKHYHYGSLITSDHYILNFGGNASIAQMYAQSMLSNAIDMECNQIHFNYRGVVNSTGYLTSKQDLIVDGIAQVQRLFDAGVKPENIILKGLSLGGGVATQVAEHFHARGSKVYLYNERSFSSITRVVTGWLRFSILRNGHTDSLLTRILGKCSKPFIRFGLSITKWEIDAGTSYSKIPAEFKQHNLVRSDKMKRARHIDDTVITHYASLHNDPAVRQQRKKYVARIKHRITKYAGNEALTALYVGKLNDVKASKMSHIDYYEEGHNAGEDDVFNRFGETARKHFHRFFTRVKGQTQHPVAGNAEAEATVNINEMSITTQSNSLSLSA